MTEPTPVSERFRVRLPAEPNRLVGRDDDVARVDEQLREGRLVSLVGPPGIGKTRLALRMAHRAAPRGWFCNLLDATDSSGLCAAVARGLGVPAGPKPVATLGRRIAALGEVLIVLDNLEQLVDEAAPVLEQWLAAAPEARFVVTTRERLRLPAERVIELAPLPLPAADRAEGQACELFVERVRASRAAYEPTDAEHKPIADLVRALDGIPLALELAAARVDVLGVEGLLERMSRPLEVLSHGARGADPRQATLRGAIDASWRLLSEAERDLLACASLFRGGFTVDAAEAALGRSALDELQALRDRSLLLAPEPGRFALYASIRAFAAERFAERSALSEAPLRLANHVLAVAEEEGRRFAERGGALTVAARERDNLLAIFERAILAGDVTVAARVVLVLTPLLVTRGPSSLLSDLAERALTLVGDDAALLHARACARWVQADLDSAVADLLAALDLEPEGSLYVSIRKDLGRAHHHRRDIDAARACYEAALARATSLGDRRAEGSLVSNLGALDHDIGRFEAAARRYGEGLDLLRAVGDARLEGITLTNLGVLEQEQGRADAARARYARALELLRDAGDFRFEAITLGNLGLLEHEAGDLDAARQHHEEALALLVEVGDTASEALSRARLGAVLAAGGEPDRAERELDEAERRVIGRDGVALDLVRLHRSFLDRARGDDEAARGRILAAQTERDGNASLAAINDDARLVLRVLGRQQHGGEGPRLKVGPDAMWFEVPGGSRQSLERFKAARRILHHLATARLERPGVGVPGDELFAAGWPGVTIAAESANNRLYVALAKLRKMGLKMHLLRNDEGYLLDASVPLLRAES